MKMQWILVLALALVFSASQAYTQDSTDVIYRQCIDQRIKQCELKADRRDSKGANIRASAETAARQADFYNMRKEELVREMAAGNIETKPHKINYFLIQAYRSNRGQDRGRQPN